MPTENTGVGVDENRVDKENTTPKTAKIRTKTNKSKFVCGERVGYNCEAERRLRGLVFICCFIYHLLLFSCVWSVALINNVVWGGCVSINIQFHQTARDSRRTGPQALRLSAKANISFFSKQTIARALFPLLKGPVRSQFFHEPFVLLHITYMYLVLSLLVCVTQSKPSNGMSRVAYIFPPSGDYFFQPLMLHRLPHFLS